MKEVLTIKGLSLGIKTELVRDISFSLKEKEFLAIVGPNGCGKSTFIRTIMGTVNIFSGELSFLGKPLSSYSHKMRSRYIAFMGQNNTVDPQMRVLDYISLGRFPHFHYSTRQYDNECITRVIAELGLETLIEQKVGQLSGGEFQRVNLARVLVQEPKLLLLDEPTNHLDPKARIELLKIVKDKQITTIAVLHDLNLAEYFADQVMIINRGKMQVCDTVENTLNAHWIKDTFDLNTLHFLHPTTGKAIRFFEID
ncbi:TPA: ABC transporter ATP-binding protein [Vibrio harveyi]|nr:ABC transporter ATP-binding protein [Vibrio harveyi]